VKATIKIEKEVDIKSVRVEVAIRYDEEDVPNDFPLREGDIWKATIDIETGKIEGWPAGITGHLNMKVCDEGSYYLLDQEGNTILSLEGDYVPNELVPGSYGDYIDLQINDQGFVTNWCRNPSIDDFIKD